MNNYNFYRSIMNGVDCSSVMSCIYPIPIYRRIMLTVELERLCSQTQLCQLRCLMTILDILIDRVVFDYIPFPVLTHTHTHNGDDTLPKLC